MTALFPEDVQIGVAPDYIEYVLPFASSAQYQKEARVRVALTIAPEALTLAGLSRGTLDLVLSGNSNIEDEDFDCERVYDDRMFVVSAHDHPLAVLPALRLADLVGQDWAVASEPIQRQLTGMFEERALPPPRVSLISSSSSLRMSRVATSRLLGVHSVATLLALAEARALLAILPVTDLVWYRPVMAVYRSSRRHSSALRRVIEDMKAIAVKPSR